MTLEIRRINPGEFDEVGDLIVDSYGHVAELDGDLNGYLVLPDGSPDDDYAAELRAVEQRNVDAEVWLAVHGEDVLGCVTWCPVGSSYRELAVKDTQAEFRGLAVAPHARGRGAGRALVEHCLDLARNGGHDEVVLCSLPEMKTAHRLYESLGFGRRPELDWSPLEGVTLWAFGLADLS